MFNVERLIPACSTTLNHRYSAHLCTPCKQGRTYKYPYRLRCHIASEMLTYCHAPARSYSRLISCEDRALTIRGFPHPAACREGCKGFWSMDPSPTLPCMGGGSYNRKHRASKTVPLRQAGRGAKRRRGWMIQTDLRSMMSVDDCFSLMTKGE